MHGYVGVAGRGAATYRAIHLNISRVYSSPICSYVFRPPIKTSNAFHLRNTLVDLHTINFKVFRRALCYLLHPCQVILYQEDITGVASFTVWLIFSC